MRALVRARLIPAAAPLLALAVAFLARYGPHTVVDTPDGTWINDPDACFHLRRVFLLLANGGLPDRDFYSDFPEGTVPYVAPLLDWLVFGVCRMLGLGVEDETAVCRIGALIPAILGALTVLPVHAFARRVFGRGTAAAAALVLAVLPGHILYTRYGMADHHVLEGLLLATLVYGTTVEGRWRPAVLGALCLLGLALAWNGFALYVIAFAGVSALAPWRLTQAGAARAPAVAARTLAVFLPLLAACVVLPGYWFRQGEVRYDAPSLFHLVLTLACAIWCAAAARLLRLPALAGTREFSWLDRRPWGRVGAVLAAGAAIGAVALLLPGPLREAFTAMLAFPGISVNRFNLEGRPIWTYTEWIFDHFTGLSFLVPVALYAICAVAEEDGRDPEPVWVLAGWTLAFFLLTAWMTRFTYALAPFLALTIAGLAWATARAAAAFRPWLATPECRGAIGAAVVCGCLLPTLDTIHGVAAGRYEGAARRPRTLRELRTLTPAPGDWRRPETTPAYGILAPWGFGHAIKFWARRPVVSDNMGVGFEKEFRFSLARDEEEAYSFLRSLRVRYVIVQHDHHLIEQYAGAFGGPERPRFATRGEDGEWRVTEEYGRRVWVRLMGADGSASYLDDGLSHFRLVVACAEPGREGSGPYEFKCFEVVPGARLVGRCEGGERVSARASLTAGDGRAFAHERRGRADSAGRFVLVVPYAAEYTVSAGLRSARVAVDEPAVRAGAERAVAWER